MTGDADVANLKLLVCLQVKCTKKATINHKDRRAYYITWHLHADV